MSKRNEGAKNKKEKKEGGLDDGIKHSTSKRQQHWPDLPGSAVAAAAALLVAERGDMPGIAVGLAVCCIRRKVSGVCVSPSSATHLILVIYISNDRATCF